MKFADAQDSSIVDATSKDRSSNPMPRPCGMNCKVANMCFAVHNLSAARLCCRPTSTSNKDVRFGFRNVVSSRYEQCRVGLGHDGQSGKENAAVVAGGKQLRIACL